MAIKFLICHLFLVIAQYEDTSFHLYETNREAAVVSTKFDCLYAYSNIEEFGAMPGSNRAWSLVPFCRRSHRVQSERRTSRKSNDLICHGTSIFFKELHALAVTSDNLYSWGAPIDVIDQYMASSSADKGDLNTFCNCTREGLFGSHCEYSFPPGFDTFPFQRVVEQQFAAKTKLAGSLVNESMLTCYMGLQCSSIICLDWRQICNGIVDCQEGEDEIHCAELELNSCNNAYEYRCTNGLCISRQFAFDNIFDCLDLSDEQSAYHGNPYDHCYLSASVGCEEYNCAWLDFPCGDGQCRRTLAESRSSSCNNNRDTIYKQQLFDVHSKDYVSLCWKALMCYLHPDIVNPIYKCFSQLCKPNCQKLVCETCTNNTWLEMPKHSIVPLAHIRTYVAINCSTFNQLKITWWICNNYTCSQENELTIWDQLLAIIQVTFSFSWFHAGPKHHPIKFECNQSRQWISKYRVSDGIKDCAFSEDEMTSIALDDRFHCRSADENYIPRRYFLDGKPDCSDKSDEPYRMDCHSVNQFSCTLIRSVDFDQPIVILFQHVCDGIQWMTTAMNDGETDETNCEDWFCDSRPNQCNGFWNCHDGRDELDCPLLMATYITYNVSGCRANEHYCLRRSENDSSVLFMGCLPIQQAGDDNVDCIGAMDERMGYCRLNFPWTIDEGGSSGAYRFHCSDSRDCINIASLCDGYDNCLNGEDELICPWKIAAPSKCSNNQLLCKNGQCTYLAARCNGFIDCWPDADDELFCDLIEKHIYHSFSFNGLYSYPINLSSSTSVDLSRFQKMTIVSASILSNSRLLTDASYPTSYCNRGIFVYEISEKSVCLCPPSSYGDHCQFQSERITLFLQIQTIRSFPSRSLFRLVCYLFNQENTLLDMEEIVHSPYNQSIHKHIIYLVRTGVPLSSVSVRIDAYQVNELTVHFHSSWHFSIPFPFLPVNRLAYELLLRGDIQRKCDTKSMLNCLHGVCLFYANNVTEAYCQCDSGWTGAQCEIKLNCSCADRSLCVQGNICVCPTGRIGRTCHVTFDPCQFQRNMCLYNGTCLPVDERAIKTVCICTSAHFGDRCQFSSAHLTIRSSLETKESVTAATIVHFLNIHEVSTKGSIVFTGFLTSIQRILYTQELRDTLHIVLDKQEYLPTFVYVQIISDAHNFYGTYYLAAALFDTVPRTSLTTVIKNKNRCPHIDEMLEGNLTLSSFHHLKRVKYYNDVCTRHQTFHCFHDEFYMCFCDQRRRIDCLVFDHSANNCSLALKALCLNEALCLQATTDNVWNFHCVCPKCYYGSMCQFTTSHYSVSLDALIGSRMSSDSLYSQPVVVYYALAFICLLSVIALVGNTLSILVFCRSGPRKVACGLYLLILSVVAQLAIFVLILRFTYLIVTHLTGEEHKTFAEANCLILENLLSVLPAMFDWLTACIAVERALQALHGVAYRKEFNRHCAKIVIVATLLLVAASSAHEPVYRQLTADPRSSTLLTWCVLTFDKIPWLHQYESISNIIHLIGPFAINLTSTMLFLICLTRRKATSSLAASKKKTYFSILNEQIVLFKPLVISPIVLIILTLPRLISTFALACIQYPWQNYVYLAGLFISFTPLAGTIFIYIWPSPSYMSELKIVFKHLHCAMGLNR